MKVKVIAAACAALCSAAAMATPLNPNDSGVITAVNAGHVFYVSGASAQKNVLDNVLKNYSTIFATPADVVKITGPNGSIGYLGTSIAALGGTAYLVIYNSTNGSAAGLNQLLSTGTGEAEADVLKLDATCSAVTGLSGSYVASCTTHQPTETKMALSDVFSNEFGSSGSLCTTTGTGCPGPAYNAISSMVSPISAKSSGLEGFGVIVNANLYNALLAQNITDGLLPSGCSTATAPSATTGACQPSIRSRDYAALATLGSGWDSTALFPAAGAANIKLARRDELSGTQAASNIFFLNNVCGGKGYFGKLTPARAVNSAGTLTITEEPGTGNVETAVAGAANYGMGVVSLGEKDHADDSTKAYWFVKIDNQSPNYVGGTYDATKRKQLANGNYTFATEMAAYVIGTPSQAAINIATDIQNAAKQPVGGIIGVTNLDAPLSWPDGKQSKYARGGNNCAPLH